MKSYIIQEDKLFSEKIQHIISNFSESIITLFKDSQFFICGKTIRDYLEDKVIKNLNFFCTNKEIFHIIKTELENNNFELINEEGYVIQMKNNIYNIEITFIEEAKDIIEVLEYFDFIIEKAGYYKGVLILHKKFLHDLKNKQLSYCHHHDPKKSFIKQQKMGAEEGYVISKADLKMIELDLDKLEK